MTKIGVTALTLVLLAVNLVSFSDEQMSNFQGNTGVPLSLPPLTELVAPFLHRIDCK
jgi:hypothetical protein